ncbi:hypothetical protein J132_01906 [Termitomyces sp. J132]|nr:hypothetical protein J132_01906 [Termitomyces sp. J132]
MVTLNVVNPVGAGVRMDGTAADAWNSLTSLHDAKTDLGLLHAEEELSSIKYTDGTSIEAHFKAMRTAWAKANDQGAEINDRRFRAYIIKSMPATWAAVTGSLMGELTSAKVIVRLTTHALLLHGATAVAATKSPQALFTQGNRQGKDKSTTCSNCS